MNFHSSENVTVLMLHLYNGGWHDVSSLLPDQQTRERHCLILRQCRAYYSQRMAILINLKTSEKPTVKSETFAVRAPLLSCAAI
jgi:hypothetical protein